MVKTQRSAFYITYYTLISGTTRNPLDYMARSWGNALSHTCVYNFFTTGIFSLSIPGMVSLKGAYNPLASTSLDFMGLNYYSHNYMRFFKPLPAPDEIATANPQYTIYAEGLYRAIAEIAEQVTQPLEKRLGKEIPIYVTENGVGTDTKMGTDEDQTRDIFFKRTLHALSQAHKEYNVKGYIHWSFMDNYEWGTYSKKYGIYSVDFTTQERAFKKGAQHYKDVLTYWAQPGLRLSGPSGSATLRRGSGLKAYPVIRVAFTPE